MRPGARFAATAFVAIATAAFAFAPDAARRRHPHVRARHAREALRRRRQGRRASAPTASCARAGRSATSRCPGRLRDDGDVRGRPSPTAASSSAPGRPTAARSCASPATRRASSPTRKRARSTRSPSTARARSTPRRRAIESTTCRPGKAEVFATLAGVDSVFALAFDKGGRASSRARAPTGRSCASTPGAGSSVYFKTDEPFVVSLAVGDDGDGLRGNERQGPRSTASRGRGAPRCSTTSPGEDVHAIAVGPNAPLVRHRQRGAELRADRAITTPGRTARPAAGRSPGRRRPRAPSPARARSGASTPRAAPSA